MHAISRPEQPYRASKDEFLAFLMAYVLLATARYEAQAQRLHPHDHCVSVWRFQEAGIGTDVLTWMQYHGHVEHLQQQPSAVQRDVTTGRPVDSVVFNETSAFALTNAGLAFAGDFMVSAFLGGRDGVREAWDSLVLGCLLPHYDGDDRLFTWGAHVIKHFEQRAGNQELVLLAAQELVWPRWLDDPLPPGQCRSAKARLHDTIKDLNRRQQVAIVHFRGDGTGTRLGWEYR
jgi:hypothetical protein